MCSKAAFVLVVDQAKEAYYLLGEISSQAEQWQRAADYFKKVCDFDREALEEEE